VVLVRQRPGTAGGVVFATIEDETGTANVVIWPSLTERYRRAIVGSRLLGVDGRVQRSPEGVVHLVAEHLHDRSAELWRIAEDGLAPPRAHADEALAPRSAPRHPRQERVVPKSRDFH
jgi:error-prone DNA polymerase